MKKFFITLALACAICAQGHTVRKGNTFVQTRKTATRDTLVTKYNYQTQDGKSYPIIVNKQSGACYIWKISKNGKGYRQYMDKEIKESICNELKIKTK